jgi:hypothetical protein
MLPPAELEKYHLKAEGGELVSLKMEQNMNNNKFETKIYTSN